MSLTKNRILYVDEPDDADQDDYIENFGAALLEEPMQECKMRDNLITWTNIPVAGQISTTAATGCAFLDIPTGFTQIQRIGDSIVVRGIFFEGIFTANTEAAMNNASDVTIRLWAVLDRHPIGVAATFGGIFGGSGVATYRRAIGPTERYLVLKHWVIELKPYGVSGAFSNVHKYINWMYKCEIPVKYSGSTGAMAEVRRYNFYLCYAAYGNTTADFSGVTRTYFVDGE